jgi:tetratricopeptide (TPR) repeat protein/GT2 family glycosyltransferase
MPTAAGTMELAARRHQRGHLREAEQLYRLVLQNNPDNAAALHSLGIIAHQTGNHDKAVELINKAIVNNPRMPQYHNTLGLIFEAGGEFEQAILAYHQAILIKPDYAEAYHNMAIALQSQGRYTDAIEKCKQAILLKSDYAEVYNTMAFCLEKQEQYAEAIENYKRALRLKPDFAEAYNHLGYVLNKQGKSEEAIESFRQALDVDPNYAEAYSNLGIALKDREQFAEAIENFEQAIRIEPDFAEAYYNLANSLRDEGKCSEAIENYKQAIRLKPDYTEAHWNTSLTSLLNGNFIEGWKGYRWRQNIDLKILIGRHYKGKPRWDGTPFEGKRLFVHYEQGLGDNIQFVRYLPMIKARGGTVIFETLKPLIALLKDFPGADQIVENHPDGKPSVDFDIYTSLLDMPNIFGTTLETIPSEIPYIHADPAKAQYWRNKLAGPYFKVGIVWAGSPAHGNDRYRSCKLKDFAPLAKIDGVRLYGLQKGKAAAQMEEMAEILPIVDISKEFEDFTDTAAAIENLDLVISVDTSVLHLAGAMGKPTWALLPYAPEWRWMLDRQDSPWYPTMKLYRQKDWGRWEPVFEQVASELQIAAKNVTQLDISHKNHGHKQMIPAIIPYHRNTNQLEKCIAHLKNQTVQPEIFVRDNDNDNIYFTAAVNEGIRKYLDQPCKYILVLNQDMYLESSAVEKMAAFMDSHPECGIGAPLQLYDKNPNYVIFAGGYEAFPAGKHQHGQLSEFTKDAQIFWCSGACMMLRKTLIQEIGLLDENFIFIGSDSDYCFTARARGWQIWRIAGARGIHECGASGSSNNINTEILKIKDMLYFAKKWLTGRLYEEIAYEGKTLSPETVKSIVTDLEQTRSELELCRH